jgi:hypothetical protein
VSKFVGAVLVTIWEAESACGSLGPVADQVSYPDEKPDEKNVASSELPSAKTRSGDSLSARCRISKSLDWTIFSPGRWLVRPIFQLPSDDPDECPQECPQQRLSAEP